jgi:Winged helix DNA-binding domain
VPTPTVTRERVLGFRLRRQHLHRRLPAGRLGTAVADCCGIRNSPPGSAGPALDARVDGLAADTVAGELAAGSLVEVLGPRLVPTLVRPEDVGVLTVGVLPADERALTDVIGRLTAKDLAAAGIGLADAVREVTEAARAELAAGPRTRGDLSAALTRRLPAAMSSWCERCGSRHVRESLFRIPGGAGVYRIEPRSDRQVSFARLDDPPGQDPEPARLELVRRFLRCYGPATPEHFAGWTGTGPVEARRRWAALAGELVEVGADGTTGSVLAADEPALRRAAPPEGVRLLPPGDPYLLARDRAWLVPDPAARAAVWPSIAAPGVVLHDGELVATWRARKRGSTLEVDVGALAGVPAPAGPEVEAEAARLAAQRGCATAAVRPA